MYNIHICIHRIFLHDTDLIFFNIFLDNFRLAALGDASGLSPRSWKCVSILIIQGLWEQDWTAVKWCQFLYFVMCNILCTKGLFGVHLKKKSVLLSFLSIHNPGFSRFWWWCQISCILILCVKDIWCMLLGKQNISRSPNEPPTPVTITMTMKGVKRRQIYHTKLGVIFETMGLDASCL